LLNIVAILGTANVNEGYKYVVDMDLEKYFDTVNQSKLVEVLSRTIKDGRVISLIHEYLRAGVIVRNSFEETEVGVPQGGPLSPILSNIMLNELDKELERRGHRFFRYADDLDDLLQKQKKRKARAKQYPPLYREKTVKIGELCLNNGVLVFSDEIHSDLIFKGYKHTPLGMLDERMNQNVITAYSASKTFNLAGLQTSAIIIANEEIRKKYINQLEINCVSGLNIFGTIALEAAYNHGEQYLNELLEYVQANVDYAIDYAKKNLKGVKVLKPQATYLVWIDFRATGLSADEIDALVIEKAKIAPDLGRWFGEEGAGFLRFNFACPRSTLEKALEQLKYAIDNIGVTSKELKR